MGTSTNKIAAAQARPVRGDRTTQQHGQAQFSSDQRESGYFLSGKFGSSTLPQVLFSTAAALAYQARAAVAMPK